MIGAFANRPIECLNASIAKSSISRRIITHQSSMDAGGRRCPEPSRERRDRREHQHLLGTAHRLCDQKSGSPVAPRDGLEHDRRREVERGRERPQRHHAKRRRGRRSRASRTARATPRPAPRSPPAGTRGRGSTQHRDRRQRSRAQAVRLHVVPAPEEIEIRARPPRQTATSTEGSGPLAHEAGPSIRDERSGSRAGRQSFPPARVRPDSASVRTVRRRRRAGQTAEAQPLHRGCRAGRKCRFPANY